MNNKLVLGYWPFRGYGQVARLLLAYTKADWEQFTYTDGDKWFKEDKVNLGLDFPNLPYVIDGDFKITQTGAVYRYIINRSGKKDLLGKDEKDQIKQFQIEGVMLDIITAFIRVAWNPEDTESKKESLNLKFSQINEFYGEKEFAFGYLTLIDFRIAEFANWVEKLYPEEFAKYPVFQRTREAFNNLPEIKEYYSSEKAVKGPFLPSSAKVSF